MDVTTTTATTPTAELSAIMVGEKTATRWDNNRQVLQTLIEKHAAVAKFVRQWLYAIAKAQADAIIGMTKGRERVLVHVTDGQNASVDRLYALTVEHLQGVIPTYDDHITTAGETDVLPTLYDGLLFCWNVTDSADSTSLLSAQVPSNKYGILAHAAKPCMDTSSSSMMMMKSIYNDMWVSVFEESFRYQGVRCKNPIYVHPRTQEIRISQLARGMNLEDAHVKALLDGEVVRQAIGWSLTSNQEKQQYNMYLPLTEVKKVMALWV